MTNKEFILDSLIDGLDIGESEEQIRKYFEFIKVKIDEEELGKLINELIEEKLIYITKNKYLFDKSMYALTKKGREFWSISQGNKHKETE